MATPLTATPIPAYTAVPDVPADLTAALNNLEKFAIPRFATTVARDAAITAPTEGQMAFVTGTHLLYEYSGVGWAVWQPLIVCTNATRPATPVTGMEIYETDTKNHYTYDGSAWLLDGKSGGAPFAMAAGSTTINFGTGSGALVAVTFPASRFTVAPLVTATVATAGGSVADAKNTVVHVQTITTSGFNLEANKGDNTNYASGSIVFDWIAIQMTTTTAAG